MNTIARCKPLLGTFVEISISGDCERKLLLDCSEAAFDRIQDIHEKMSFHNDESELSVLNRSAFRAPVKISKELSDVLVRGIYYSQISNGLFDMTIGHQLVKKGKLPDHGFDSSAEADWKDVEMDGDSVFFKKPLLIDLGGIAKGHAVDVGFKSIQENELTKERLSKIVVNAGGDLRSWPWEGEKVTIRIPREPYTETTDVTMQNSSIATSGPYFGGSIVADRAIISDGPSVSVFSDYCIDADALTKIYSICPNKILKGVDHKNLTVDQSGSKTWGTR
ncbi:MAG: FAD:protein FMN transferase [Pseudomonadota bacterium]|nr:FAD:protein FMN transferase [Pseudomonadota bacterium]